MLYASPLESVDIETVRNRVATSERNAWVMQKGTSLGRQFQHWISDKYVPVYMLTSTSLSTELIDSAD